jgi:ribosomal protein L40E
MVMKCDDVLCKISLYLEDDLAPALKRAIEEHIAQCRQCGAVRNGMRNIIQLYGDETIVNPPAGFYARLHDRLSDQIEGQKGSLRGWLVGLVATGALAALGLFATVQNRFVPEPRAQMSQPARRMPQQLVAIVDEGKTFHVPGCPYMHGKYRMVTPDEAIREGYTPCRRCMSETLRIAGNVELDFEGLEVASSVAPAK